MKIVVKLRANCDKIVHFNSINSEIIGQKLTKFGHDVARLLRLKVLKADLRLANPLSNAKPKSKGRAMHADCLKVLRGQISTICTEMIANYSAEIKIVIFQSFWNADVTNDDHRQIAGEWRQKLRLLTA